MSIKTTGQDAYFAASNSTAGFISYYEELFRASRIGHIWAVKGGPGTGKSRFLWDVSDCAVQGEWSCEYIYCSSDPNSLDAIILTKEGREGIALLDATAPHLFEPICPGAWEDIVNLGQFWKSEAAPRSASTTSSLITTSLKWAARWRTSAPTASSAAM